MRWFRRSRGRGVARVKLSDEQLKLLDSISASCLNLSSPDSEEPNRPPGEAVRENGHTENLPVESMGVFQPDENIHKEILQSVKARHLKRFEDSLDHAEWIVFIGLIGLAVYYFATVNIAKAVSALSSAISVLRSIIKCFRAKKK